MSIKVLPVRGGDSLLIKYRHHTSEVHNILVDTGYRGSYKASIKSVILELQRMEQSIDLVIITHIDRDHIGGLIKYLQEIRDKRIEDIIMKYWFNSSRIITSYFNIKHSRINEVEIPENGEELTVQEGITLEEYLFQYSKGNAFPIFFKNTTNVLLDNTIRLNEAEFIILSPDSSMLKSIDGHWKDEINTTDDTYLAGTVCDYKTNVNELKFNLFKEDTSIPNASSIAFILKFRGKTILMLGDAYPTVVEESLRKLQYCEDNKLVVDCVKLSHHGSKKNINNSLMGIIDSRIYIISTNGKNRSSLPHKEALVRVICSKYRDYSKKIFFVFNHDNLILRSIFTVDEQKKYNFECIYPKIEKEGIEVVWDEGGKCIAGTRVID